MKKLVFILAIITMIWSASKAQNSFFEDSGNPITYQLDRFNILIIAYENSPYEDYVPMYRKWKEWGANVKIASNKLMFNGEMQSSGSASLKADILISQVNPDNYDAVYIAGGGNSILLVEQFHDDMKRILTKVHNHGKIISAYCHSPAVLSVCDFIKGINVTIDGFPQRETIVNAGANVKNDIILCDRNIITGRYPYIETFTNFVAEKLQYPDGNGPFAALSKKRNATLDLMQNLSNAQLFSNKEISKDTLKLIIQSGMKSVISESYQHNSVIRFACVTNHMIIDKIQDLLIRKNINNFSSNSDLAKRYFNRMLNNSQVIVLSYNNNADIDTISNSQYNQQLEMKYVSYNGASCQNMLMASKALGIGGSLADNKWFLSIDNELKDILSLPENYKLVNVVIMGFSDFDYVPSVTRPIEEFVQFK